MSNNNYDQYGGGAYQSQGGYASADPYGTSTSRPQVVQHTSSSYSTQTPTTQYGAVPIGHGTANSYTTSAGLPGQAPGQAGVDPNHQPGYNADYSTPGVVRLPPPSTVLSNHDFLARVEAVRGNIRELTANVSEVGVLHQRMLGDPTANNAQLENLVTRTQVLNTSIKDSIQFLETDMLKGNKESNGKNTTKESQIRTLKGHFKSQLEDYRGEESAYRKRYQEQIAREYKIVNPDATDAEIQEAATADWGSEGVFQTALKSNRTAAANSVLGNVRARHNDIIKIEKTLEELAQLFNDLAVQVELQETAVQAGEEQTKAVHEDTEAANTQLEKAKKHALSRRKLKWICLGIVVLIIIIVIAVVLGIVCGLQNQCSSKNNKR